MTAIPLTRRKLRQARFFLGHLGGCQPTVVRPQSEAAEFFLEAFLTAARAVSLALQKERKAEWDAWILAWDAKLSDADRELWNFLVEQRNKAQKEGTAAVAQRTTALLLHEFIARASLEGAEYWIHTGVPGTPHPTFNVREVRFSDYPDVPLIDYCTRCLDYLERMVCAFEQAHAPE